LTSTKSYERIADVGGAPESHTRTHFVRRIDEILDLPSLIGQDGPPAALGRSRDETVVVALWAEAPEDTEEEIANQYGLELIDRRHLASLGIRIARYRARDGKSVDAVLDELKKDGRIRQAQSNYVYHRVSPGAPAASPAQGEPPAVAMLDTGKSRPSVAVAPPSGQRPSQRKAQAPTQSAPKRTERVQIAAVPPGEPSRDERGATTARSSPRTIGIADVLAGGL